MVNVGGNYSDLHSVLTVILGLLHTCVKRFILSDPVLVDTAMSAVGCQWNHDGSILAVAGMMSTGGDKVFINLVTG